MVCSNFFNRTLSLRSLWTTIIGLADCKCVAYCMYLHVYVHAILHLTFNTSDLFYHAALLAGARAIFSYIMHNVPNTCVCIENSPDLDSWTGSADTYTIYKYKYIFQFTLLRYYTYPISPTLPNWKVERSHQSKLLFPSHFLLQPRKYIQRFKSRKSQRTNWYSSHRISPQLHCTMLLCK